MLIVSQEIQGVLSETQGLEKNDVVCTTFGDDSCLEELYSDGCDISDDSDSVCNNSSNVWSN